MNISYHFLIGVGLYGVTNEPSSLVASVIPDLSLIGNEIKIRVKKEKFNPEKVDKYSYIIYHMVHSILFCFLILYFDKWFSLGLFIHQICDWFTHTGRFATMPLYPISTWKIPFGKEVLK